MRRSNGFALALAIACLPPPPAAAQPYGADPAFNAGATLEDRFAGASSNNYFGRQLVQLGDGTLVVAGIVPAAFQAGSGNVGLVRYGAAGERLAWPAPTASYVSFFDRYITYPNITAATYVRVDDLDSAGGYLFVLASRGNAGARDVDVIVFTQGGTYVATVAAFASGFDETGAGVVAYGPPGGALRLVAVANYRNSISGRTIITARRYLVAANGSLSVDNAFGPFGSGINDYPMPDGACDAGSACSGNARDTSAVRTGSASPTLYVGGFANSPGISAGRERTLVLAIDGATGLASPSFGRIATGIYVENTYLVSFNGIAARDGGGGPASDAVYLVAGRPTLTGEAQGYAALRYLAQGGNPPPNEGTSIDLAWATNGVRDLPPFCGGTTCGSSSRFPFPRRAVLAGDRLVVVGENTLNGGGIPEALLSIIGAQGSLDTHTTLAAPRIGGGAWAGSAWYDVVPRANGTVVATGVLYDTGVSVLFGTLAYGPLPDALFANGFE